jgi:hypothetical protein
MVEELIGIWRAADADVGGYLQLSADGTYRVALAVPWLETSPYDVGQFQLEETSFTFVPSNKSRDCAGHSGSYQVELTEPGQLQFVLDEDARQSRANYTPGAWDQMPPP